MADRRVITGNPVRRRSHRRGGHCLCPLARWRAVSGWWFRRQPWRRQFFSRPIPSAIGLLPEMILRGRGLELDPAGPSRGRARHVGRWRSRQMGGEEGRRSPPFYQATWRAQVGGGAIWWISRVGGPRPSHKCAGWCGFAAAILGRISLLTLDHDSGGEERPGGMDQGGASVGQASRSSAPSFCRTNDRRPDEVIPAGLAAHCGPAAQATGKPDAARLLANLGKAYC